MIMKIHQLLDDCLELTPDEKECVVISSNRTAYFGWWLWLDITQNNITIYIDNISAWVVKKNPEGYKILKKLIGKDY